MASSIAVSCQQTRFDISDSTVFTGLDIKGLNITIQAPVPSSDNIEASKAKSARKKALADGIEILSNAELKLNPGLRYALTGKNGSGKSTLLRSIAQKLIPGIPNSTRISILQQTSTSDHRHAENEPFLGIDIGGDDGREKDRASQTPLQRVLSSDSFQQVRQAEKNARLRSGARGLQARKELRLLEEKVVNADAEARITTLADIDAVVIAAETSAALDLWTDLQGQIESYSGNAAADAEKRAISILRGLGFTTEGMMKNKTFAELSGGWRMRCLLAETLFQPSDMMILDEPTNFLDLLGIVWLQRYLLFGNDLAQEDKDTTPSRVVVVVSHDRHFVDSVCDETIVLRDQTLLTFKGTPSAYEADLRSRILHLSKVKEANDRQVKMMERSIGENLREGKAKGNDNKVRAAKSRQKKLEERMGLQVSASGGRFKLSRDRVGFHDSLRDEIGVPTEESGRSIVLPGVTGLRFPGSLDINLVVHMGDRIGIVGLNGCGKTTLIKLITDTIRVPPASGTMTKHPQLKLGYYSQHAVEDLQQHADPNSTALSLMTQQVASALSEGDIRGLLSSLGLPGRTASDVPISKLSGGQLVRLALARVIWNSPSLLVLDEITTHLDHYTVSALIDALRDYEGAVLLVSHDRFLVRGVVEGQGGSGGGECEEEDMERGGSGEKEIERRRIVYLLKGGRLKVLNGGVEDFERSLEKKLESLSL
ncbi:hypothetical protein EPUS_01164 [Endocarpon pusillum Z07020]|uniref:ABC transporter domain-containing protein n=1 Tax=Endocarpon pusillum (strain Z07020 / HMAS-L-300199) TaxID=1263415 RepID=U1FWI8_ENDPU|nr:uncharacterized protein EPUS_01164 [Endocarpon pusillum Z07020]ERF69207.1 hypothetical protein EPUS_01164 [Endocarpon pusillum Z07020]